MKHGTPFLLGIAHDRQIHPPNRRRDEATHDEPLPYQTSDATGEYAPTPHTRVTFSDRESTDEQ